MTSNLRVGLAATAAILRSWRNRRQAYHLSELPDYLLADMGIKRDDVHDALAADWREDPTFRIALAAARNRSSL